MELTASRSSNYVRGFNTNNLEAINNCIAASAEKRKDYLRSYAARADIGILNNQLLLNWIIDLYKVAGFESSPFFNRRLNALMKRKKGEAAHKKEADIKRRTVLLRKNKRERNRNPIDNKKHKYKTTQKCTCTTGCKNRRCSCFKNGRGCSSRCRCDSCCNKIQNSTNETNLEQE